MKNYTLIIKIDGDFGPYRECNLPNTEIDEAILMLRGASLALHVADACNVLLAIVPDGYSIRKDED